jgi:hypothetical protein
MKWDHPANQSSPKEVNPRAQSGVTLPPGIKPSACIWKREASRCERMGVRYNLRLGEIRRDECGETDGERCVGGSGGFGRRGRGSFG